MPGCRVLSRWLFVRRASAVASVVACLALLPLCGGLPAFDPSASAAPMGGSQQWDFRIDDGRSTGGAWTASHSGGGPAAERWRWIGPSRRNDGRWAEVAAAGRGHEGRGNYLTSPVIDVKAMLGTTADGLRVATGQLVGTAAAAEGRRALHGPVGPLRPRRLRAHRMLARFPLQRHLLQHDPVPPDRGEHGVAVRTTFPLGCAVCTGRRGGSRTERSRAGRPRLRRAGPGLASRSTANAAAGRRSKSVPRARPRGHTVGSGAATTCRRADSSVFQVAFRTS